MENKISGKNIVELRTLNSQYAGNMIQAIDDHEQFYVINVAELLKLINNDNVIFNKNKKITRTHLTIKESESKWKMNLKNTRDASMFILLIY